MITYITKEGDVFDWIVWKHYGTTNVIEEVLKANPDLTNERFPAGIEIKLPYIAAKKTTEVRLWS